MKCTCLDQGLPRLAHAALNGLTHLIVDSIDHI